MTRRRVPRVGDVVVILSEPWGVEGAGAGLTGAIGEVVIDDVGELGLQFRVNHAAHGEIITGAWWYRRHQLEVIGDVR